MQEEGALIRPLASITEGLGQGIRRREKKGRRALSFINPGLVLLLTFL